MSEILIGNVVLTQLQRTMYFSTIPLSPSSESGTPGLLIYDDYARKWLAWWNVSGNLRTNGLPGQVVEIFK
jgi:hypothetical protein